MSYGDLLNAEQRTIRVIEALIRVRNHADVLVQQYQAGEDIDDAVASLEDRIARADAEAAPAEDAGSWRRFMAAVWSGDDRVDDVLARAGLRDEP